MPSLNDIVETPLGRKRWRTLIKCLYCHEPLLNACKAIIDAWEGGDLAAAANQCSEAIAYAEEFQLEE